MQLWWFSFFVVCSFVISLAVALPTTVETDVTTSSDSEVPLEFPNVNQNYTFVDNSSIRDNLASHSGNDTEVDDLLGKDLKESQEKTQENEESEDVPKNEETVPNPSEQGENLGRKGAIEWIEDGDDTEDKKFVTETNQSSSTEKHDNTQTTEEETTEKKIETTEKQTSTEAETTTEMSQKSMTVIDNEPYKDGVPVIDGSVAAILVGVFFVVCIFGYTALILWRRSLELKYGSREMLVDKDDFYDPDDLQHFSI